MYLAVLGIDAIPARLQPGATGPGVLAFDVGTSTRGAGMADEVQSKTDDELTPAQGTPGIRRRTAFEGRDHWFGHAVAEADTMSGWHHHGEHTTVGYILKGSIRLEYGPGGSHSTDVGRGEWFTVPAGVIHREGNTSHEDAEALVLRFGEGPPVFPADGPEPA